MEVPKWIAVLLLVPEAREMRPKMAPEGHPGLLCSFARPVEIGAQVRSSPYLYVYRKDVFMGPDRVRK